MRRYGGNQSCCKLQTFLAKFVFSIPSSLISLVATQKHDSQWNPRAVSFRECIPRDSPRFLEIGEWCQVFCMEHFEAACLPDQTDDIWKSNLHNGSHWDFSKFVRSLAQPLCLFKLFWLSWGTKISEVFVSPQFCDRKMTQLVILSLTSDFWWCSDALFFFGVCLLWAKNNWGKPCLLNDFGSTTV